VLLTAIPSTIDICREKAVGNVYINFCGRKMKQSSDTGEELPFTLHFLSCSGPNGTMEEKEWLIKCEVFRTMEGLNSMTYRPLRQAKISSVKKKKIYIYPPCYETREFITIFTKACNSPLS
jgi:hypothetical protein